MVVNIPVVPVVGASTGQWGQILNDAFAALVAQISQINNTSDANKPISTAVGNALAAKAPLASPGFSGIPTVPTAAGTTNSGQIASTAFVQNAISVSAGAFGDASATSKGVLALAGDLAGTAAAPILKAVGTAGTFGSATVVPVITVDSKGRVTGVVPTPINSAVQTNPQTTATYTAVLGDVGKTVEMNYAGANSFVIPPNSVVAIPIGTLIVVCQMGSGQTTIVPGAGVTVRTASTFTISGQYGQVTLRKRANDEWVLSGATIGGTPSSGTGTGTGTGTGGTGGTTGGGGTSTGGSGTGGTGGGTTPGGGGTGSTTTNLIPTASVQNASDASKFSAAPSVPTVSTTIAQEAGGSSIKVTPAANGAYVYLGLAAAADAAPVTVGQTYTVMLSVRAGSSLLSDFRVYPVTFDSGGTSTYQAPGATVTMVANQWIQASATIVVPAGATKLGFGLEVRQAGLAATDVFYVDHIGVNAGTSSAWSTGTPTTYDPQTAASVTDAGFAYNGTWQSITGEHYSSVVGDTATLTVTIGTGGGTVSLLGNSDPSNGTIGITVDNGTTPTNVSESGSSGPNTVIWTSGSLSAGAHTIKVVVVTPDASINGATTTRGAFTAPAGSTPGTGTGTVTPPAGTGGGTTGGGTSNTNPSGLLPPSATAFSGWTRVYVEDFNTDVSLPNFGITQYKGMNGYEGIVSGASGTNWTSKTTTTVSGGAVHLRNFMQNGVAQCGALTPLSSQPSSSWNQQSQLYGKYVARIRSSSTVGFKVAFLLWPTSNNWSEGEIDYPEANLNGTLGYSTHNVIGDPEDQIWGYAGGSPKFGDGQWHTYTFTWTSSAVVFEYDGTVIKTVTDSNYIPKKPMRWDLQCEISTDGTRPTSSSDGTVDIDWLAQYKLG